MVELLPAGSPVRAWLDGCKRHKVHPGLHTGSSAYAKRMIAMGFQFVTLMGDARLLTMAVKAAAAYAALFGSLLAGAAFAPPLETATSAGRSTRSPIMKPACTT